jgi:hypothetical protein
MGSTVIPMRWLDEPSLRFEGPDDQERSTRPKSLITRRRDHRS